MRVSRMQPLVTFSPRVVVVLPGVQADVRALEAGGHRVQVVGDRAEGEDVHPAVDRLGRGRGAEDEGPAERGLLAGQAEADRPGVQRACRAGTR